MRKSHSGTAEKGYNFDLAPDDFSLFAKFRHLHIMSCMLIYKFQKETLFCGKFFQKLRRSVVKNKTLLQIDKIKHAILKDIIEQHKCCENGLKTADEKKISNYDLTMPSVGLFSFLRKSLCTIEQS